MENDNEEDTKPKPKIGIFHSVEEFTKEGFAQVVHATNCAGAYPQTSVRDLYCSNPDFGRIIDQQCDHILGLMSKILKSENVRGNIERREQDEQFGMLLDCNDSIFERLNLNLDTLAGGQQKTSEVLIQSQVKTVTTHCSAVAGSWNLRKNDTERSTKLITAKNIPRPQLQFKTPIDNSSHTPFEPQLKDKPNSLKPLAILPEYDESGSVSGYLHPYEFELDKLKIPDELLQRCSPKEPLDITKTPLVYVDTVKALNNALNELRNQQKLAVDVEHHSYRSFQGFTCLVQISTTEKDYIFDALKLREEMHCLNEVFTNPKVLKIFHGGNLDIEWLQRDLALYVVNMFDTHQASKALNFARLSLSYLLKHYCDIEADKTFQLADWRIRPLPEELIAYARQDTHYLIYISERLINDLLDASQSQTNLLSSIYQRSTDICKKRYQKPTLGLESHLIFLRKSKRVFDNRQLYALRELYLWRDKIARIEDESHGYILPNHMLLQISQSLPREVQGILACCNPIPPLVRQNLHALHNIIIIAREQAVDKTIVNETTERFVTVENDECNNKLYCAHDNSQNDPTSDNLPTLLDGKQNKAFVVEKPTTLFNEPKLSIFGTVNTQTNDSNSSLAKRRILSDTVRFTSIYQRYKAVASKNVQGVDAATIEKKNGLNPASQSISKSEPQEIQITKNDAEEDEYSLPVKEYLKRKYEESKLARESCNNSYSNVNSSNKEEKPDGAKIESSSSHQSNSRGEPPRKRKKFQYKQQWQNQVSNTEQDSKSFDKKLNNVMCYNYKNDFDKFKGGIQRANGPGLNTQHHGKVSKGKSKNMKKFNKMFTFNNTKQRKK